MSTPTLTQYGRVRDSQRSRLYDAEQAAPWAVGSLDLTLEQCQDYVNRLCAQAWTKRRWRNLVPPTIGDARGSPRARYVAWKNSIEMPTWSRSEWVLLHEMAHYLAVRCIENCNGSGLGVRACSQEAAHGWHFARIYLDLVRHQMGTAAHDALRQAFREGRVRYKRPRAL